MTTSLTIAEILLFYKKNWPKIAVADIAN